jgi:large repetitive protein
MPSSRPPLLLALAAAVVATATCMDGSNQATPTELALSKGAQSQPVADPGGPYTVPAGQALTFDGSGSYDPSGPDGRLAYDWNLGDGANGVGIAPTHVYGEVGTYEVTLVVTSHKGVASEPAASTVTVVASAETPGDPENNAPVADAGGPYTGTVGTAIQLDGSGSSDPDGDTPLIYAWDLGDGSTAAGVAPTHTYSGAGTYTVSLVVTDSRGLASEPSTTTATVNDTPNQAPVADPGGPYSGAAGTAIQLDGSGSSDPDGDTPLTYAWDLGDGSTATGVAPTHTYGAAGTYTVSLVVTDSRGLASEPSTTTATIEAATAPSGILVRDTFSRTLSSGWGIPDIGAGWHLGSAGPDDFSVRDGRGFIVKYDNAMRNAVARDGSSSEGYGLHVQGIASFRIDTPPDNPNRFYTVQVYARRDDRVSDGDNYYRYRVRAYGHGRMDVRLEKNVAGRSTWLTDNTDLASTWQVGQQYWLRWEATGTSPTTRLRLRVWAKGTAEPTTWDIDATVNEPALDVIGTTGFRVSGPSADQTSFPVIISVGDLEYVEVD